MPIYDFSQRRTWNPNRLDLEANLEDMSSSWFDGPMLCLASDNWGIFAHFRPIVRCDESFAVYQLAFTVSSIRHETLRSKHGCVSALGD